MRRLSCNHECLFWVESDVAPGAIIPDSVEAAMLEVCFLSISGVKLLIRSHLGVLTGRDPRGRLISKHAFERAGRRGASSIAQYRHSRRAFDFGRTYVLHQ